MATLNLDGWGNGYSPEEKEQLPEEIDPIDDVMERIASLKTILESIEQPYCVTLIEQIEDKLITIFQI